MKKTNPYLETGDSVSFVSRILRNWRNPPLAEASRVTSNDDVVDGSKLYEKLLHVLLSSVEDQVADEDAVGSGFAECEFYNCVSRFLVIVRLDRRSLRPCILRTRRAGLSLLDSLGGLSILSVALGVLCRPLFLGKTASLCEEASGDYR